MNEIKQAPLVNAAFIALQKTMREATRALAASFHNPEIEKMRKEISKALLELEAAEKSSYNILKEVNWILSPSMVPGITIYIDKIGKTKFNKTEKIDNLFKRYFTEANFQNLDGMTKKWENNIAFKPRMKIINDSITLFKRYFKETSINIVSFLLPPIISQIEGIWMEIVKKNSGMINRKKEWLVENVYKYMWWELSIHMINDVLFETENNSKKLHDFSFNRHKILHGESLDYGKTANFIKALLILDFLEYVESDKKNRARP